MKTSFRPWRGGSSTAFKRRCRKAIKKALAAARKANYGSAFTPAWEEIHDAFDLLETAHDKCSVKNWGR